MGRGKLFRTPLMTFGTLSAPGVACEWTLDLAPMGERVAAAGQRVELHATLENAGEPSAAPAVAFDVLPADAAGRPADQPLVRLAGTGAPAAGAQVPTEPLTTVARDLSEGQDAAAARSAFVAEHPDDLTSQLLALREPDGRRHFLAWWTVDAGASQALHFAVEIAGRPAGRTESALRVAAGDVRLVELVLSYEDKTPMAGAELDVAFAGGVRRLVTAQSDGRAIVEMPPGVPEVFKVFLLSYPERAAAASDTPVRPVGPDPDAPDRPPPAAIALDRRPEVVAAYAFDQSFPTPAAFANLVRVRAKAAAALDTKLVVFGHTDRVGSDAYNVALSERRAKVVLALLLDDHEMFDAVAAAESWDTRAHKAMLRGVGCNPGAIDADPGPMTEAATRSFQAEYNLGVYHERAAVQRDRPTLAVDGRLGPATRAAIRDAYVAVAPHVRPDHFAEPKFDRCGKSHPISDQDADNRRAVVAFLPADVDFSVTSGCARYVELVGETPQDRRGPHFSDHQWLREEDGALHLSSATVVADGTPATIRVVRCEGPPPTPPPDSSSGGQPPVLGPDLATVPAEIRGGICFGRWTTPEAGILDPDTWLVDHDVQVEILEAADHAAPSAGDPASGVSLRAADALHPPVYIVEAGARWGVSGPPHQRLNRVRLGPDDDDPAGMTDGVALRTDGSLVFFELHRGLVDVEEIGEDVEVISLVVADHDVDPDAAVT